MSWKQSNVHPVQFRGYGVNGSEVTIVAERVTHWSYVDYNGNLGTLIYLDTGKEVLVDDMPSMVERKLGDAMKGRT